MSPPPLIVDLPSSPRLCGLLALGALMVTGTWWVCADRTVSWPPQLFARSVATLVLIGWAAGAVVSAHLAVTVVPTELRVSDGTLIIVSHALLRRAAVHVRLNDINYLDLTRRLDFDGDQYFIASLTLNDGSKLLLFESVHLPMVDRLTDRIARALKVERVAPFNADTKAGG